VTPVQAANVERVRAVVERLKASRVAEVEAVADRIIQGEHTAEMPDVRHNMPPRCFPVCGSRERNPRRATEGNPINCGACLDLILADAHLLDDGAADRLARGPRWP
jgi:hypothetical protein